MIAVKMAPATAMVSRIKLADLLGKTHHSETDKENYAKDAQYIQRENRASIVSVTTLWRLNVEWYRFGTDFCA
jgi:hypothetical protein